MLVGEGISMEKHDRIKILRILNGYNQETISALVGVMRTAYSVWESGKYGPAEESVPSLSDALCVAPGYLLFGYPPVTSAVWNPKVPPRPQHVEKLINDIKSLLPLFLEENKFNAIIPAELSDGCVFLIGRDSREGEESVGEARKKICFSCLLLCDARLVDAFKAAFEMSGVKMFGEMMVLDASLESFNAEHLDRICLKGMYWSYDAENLSKALLLAKDRGGARGRFPGLNFVARAFFEEVRRFIVPEKKVPLLTEYFESRCDELAHLPTSKINILKLSDDVRSKLKELGCIEIGGKQEPNKEQNPEFHRVKTWLQETWDGADQEQRAALISSLSKHTSFGAWLKQYEQDIADGKRPMELF